MNTEDWVNADITLSVNNVPIRFRVPVPSAPVSAQAMLPVFHQLANSFIGLSTRLLEKAGQKVSCQRGCTACCRQAIPLAEIEIYHIADLVNRLPEPRRQGVKARFDKLERHFEENGWFDKLESCDNERDLKILVLEYFFENTECPFLENAVCTIYEDRPIACREYMVTSPKENCDHPLAENLRMVPHLVSASEGVRRVGRSTHLSGRSILPLISALSWVKKHPPTIVQKTGQEWLSEFFGK